MRDSCGRNPDDCRIAAQLASRETLAIPVLGERPTGLQILGGAVLLAGVVLSAGAEPAAAASAAAEID